LHKLRKVWQSEVQQRAAAKEARIRAEKKQILLETAVRKREKKKLSLILQENDRQLKLRLKKNYEEKLGRSIVIKEERRAAQVERYKKLVVDLSEEQPAWINAQNISTKITDKLFDQKFRSTGLITRESKHWKYQALTFKWNRKYSEEVSHLIESSETAGLGSQNVVKSRQLVEELVRPMVSTGKNRSEYEDLVNDFLRTLHGNFQDADSEDPYDNVTARDIADENKPITRQEKIDEFAFAFGLDERVDAPEGEVEIPEIFNDADGDEEEAIVYEVGIKKAT